MNNRPLVGIVLVNYNGLKFMPECIASLDDQDYPLIRVVVVDNASTDGSREWLATLPPRIEKIFLDENTGITGGNNAGMKKCLELSCDEVLILNNDTILESDTVNCLVRARAPGRLLTPRIYLYDAPGVLNNYFGDFDFLRGISVQRFYGQKDSDESSSPCEGTLASTCSLMVPAEAIGRVGFMDDQFFMYFDDVDYVSRAVQIGYRVKYVPDAMMLHREACSSGGELVGPLPLYYQTRNRLYFMAKHQKNRVKLALFFAYFWLTRSVYLLRWTIRRDRRSLHAFWTAIDDYRHRKLGYAPPSRFMLGS